MEHNEFRKIQVDFEGGVGKLVQRFNRLVALMNERHEKLSDSYNDVEFSNKILAYEKERIESILDNLRDGILVTNAEGRVILVNRDFETLMNCKKPSLLDRSLEQVFEHEAILSMIQREKTQQELFAPRNTEVSVKGAGGEQILRISYLPLLNSDEEIVGTMIVTRDITAEKQVENNQAEFIAHVSHELRTPLTTIKSYVEMLLDDEISDENTKVEFYNTLNLEADRLTRLIENLLNLSKIEIGSLMIEKDLVKSLDFFEDIVRSIQSQAVSKRINLETIFPDKLTSLVVDKELFRVAVLNILGNAIKYTPAGGTVTFQVEEEQGQMRIEIRDTGYGISEEELPHIFGKFFRSADKDIKQQTGNGLGLALCQEIMHLHQGEISVTSKKGEGSQFSLHMPMDESPRIKGYQDNFEVVAKQQA
jgi:PAS domain S-box-containing protein